MNWEKVPACHDVYYTLIILIFARRMAMHLLERQHLERYLLRFHILYEFIWIQVQA